MDKDVKELIKDSADTMLNIAQMTQYRMRYAEKKDARDKEKMYKHAFLAGVGILSLLTMGVLGLMESRKNRLHNNHTHLSELMSLNFGC